MGIRRTFRSAPVEIPGSLAVEREVDVEELDELLNDFQERLFRLTPSDYRPEIRAKFEQPDAVKAVWRSPLGRLLGAAVATVESRSADLAFLHILPRHATAMRSGELLDALLSALPPECAKVRAMGGASARWLHVGATESREVLQARGFQAFDRVLLSRELGAPLPAPGALPAGYVIDHPDPSRVEEWSQFAFQAYEGTTDFGIIALEATQPAYEKLYRRFLAGEFGAYDRAHSLVALGPDGAAAGVLHTVVLGDSPYIGDLSVLPQHRGKGIGRALLLIALERYRQAGHKRAALTVTAQNTAAYNLYRSVGFEVERSAELFMRIA